MLYLLASCILSIREMKTRNGCWIFSLSTGRLLYLQITLSFLCPSSLLAATDNCASVFLPASLPAHKHGVPRGEMCTFMASSHFLCPHICCQRPEMSPEGACQRIKDRLLLLRRQVFCRSNDRSFPKKFSPHDVAFSDENACHFCCQTHIAMASYEGDKLSNKILSYYSYESMPL